MPSAIRQLYPVAESQAGYFTTAQAGALGLTPQTLHYHIKTGALERSRRGVYRLVTFPPSTEEHLVILWLWSEQEAVFSHETALVLHGLSELMPQRVHMTFPEPWRSRRMRWPTRIMWTFADLQPEERRWHDAVPVTTPARTLCDCALTGVPRDQLELAREQGLRRGLFAAAEIDIVAAYLKGGER